MVISDSHLVTLDFLEEIIAPLDTGLRMCTFLALHYKQGTHATQIAEAIFPRDPTRKQIEGVKRILDDFEQNDFAVQQNTPGRRIRSHYVANRERQNYDLALGLTSLTVQFCAESQIPTQEVWSVRGCDLEGYVHKHLRRALHLMSLYDARPVTDIQRGVVLFSPHNKLPALTSDQICEFWRLEGAKANVALPKKANEPKPRTTNKANKERQRKTVFYE